MLNIFFDISDIKITDNHKLFFLGSLCIFTLHDEGCGQDLEC